MNAGQIKQGLAAYRGGKEMVRKQRAQLPIKIYGRFYPVNTRFCSFLCIEDSFHFHKRIHIESKVFK